MKTLLCAAFAGCVCLATKLEAKQWKAIDISNESSQAIQMVELRDATHRLGFSFWLGDSKIAPGSGDVFSPHEEYDVEGLCVYHVTVTFESGSQLYYPNQNLCEFPRLKIVIPVRPPPPY